MANESILISEVIPASPQRIFSAWLDSAEHSAITGSQASVVPAVGGDHTAWDGYVQGRTLELHDGSRIVQSWRTTEFPPDSPDSRVEITLEPTVGGTLLTLLHTDIPSGQSDRYREGWNQYYLSRMKTYFSESGDASDDTDDDEPTMPLGRMPGDFEQTEIAAQFSRDDDDEPTERTMPEKASKVSTSAKKTAESTMSAIVDGVKDAAESLRKAARKSANNKLAAMTKGRRAGQKAARRAGKKVSRAAKATVGKAIKSATRSAKKVAAQFVKKATALTAKSRVGKKSATKTAAKGKRAVKSAAKKVAAKRPSSKRKNASSARRSR